MPYFNYRSQTAETSWERRAFARHWWRIYASDRRWTPPYYPALQQALDPRRNPHLARMSPRYVHVEALYRRARPGQDDIHQVRVEPAMLEVPLATAVLQHDPRRQDHTAYLSLFHCANDADSADVLFGSAAEQLMMSGWHRLIGPIGLSPYLQAGILRDHWDQEPPQDTPYNPPYLPELLQDHLRPLTTTQLYALPVESRAPAAADTPAAIRPLPVAELAGPLLPLWQTAVANPHFPPPDAVEAAFLLHWLRPATLHGWLAEVDGEPVGFVLVKPDQGAELRRARGGRAWWRRAWLAALRRRPASQGRLLYAAVLPAWRRRGIGRQLLQHALAHAHTAGWQMLLAGPVWTEDPGAAFLSSMSAAPGQSYQLYEWHI